MKSAAALCLALSAGLAGCAGAPTRIHTLSAVSSASSAVGAYGGPAFRIDAVHIPPAFDRPELVRRTDAYTVTLSDTDRWAAPLGELIRRTLTQDLAARLPASAVIFPDAPKPATAWGLVVDILSVVPGPGGIDMEVSWTWIAPRGVSAGADSARQPVSVTKVLSTRLSTSSAGTDPAAVAPELSDLLGKLADEIAARSASAGTIGRIVSSPAEARR